jgi:hypothetical protein
MGLCEAGVTLILHSPHLHHYIFLAAQMTDVVASQGRLSVF